MPIKLSHNIENIPPSATMLMTQLARDLKAEGKNIISMSAGEPDFDTPKTIKEAAIDAINRGETKYTAVDGIDDLKQAVIDKFKNDNNLNYEKGNISIAPGGKSIIFNSICCLNFSKLRFENFDSIKSKSSPPEVLKPIIIISFRVSVSDKISDSYGVEFTFIFSIYF